MAASTAIDPELVARFKAALDRLAPDGGKIGLAVSGGPDSMAMLLLAQEAIPGGFEVATVDHGLRPEAKDECALVVAACEERGVPCEVLTVEVGEGNVQAKAREARYAALAQWAKARDLSAVATGHHANDQAETVVMRLNRGVGLTGLGGIAPWIQMLEPNDAIVIRPVLAYLRTELASVVQAAGIPVCHDPSNENPDFERVRIRKALAEAGWLDAQMVRRCADHLRDADDAVWWASEMVWKERVRREGEALRFAVMGPRMVRLRIIGFAIRDFGGWSEGGDEARLLEKLERGEQANLGGVLASVDGDEWVFRPEPPRRTG